MQCVRRLLPKLEQKQHKLLGLLLESMHLVILFKLTAMDSASAKAVLTHGELMNLLEEFTITAAKDVLVGH